jgi:hypothetical protein
LQSRQERRISLVSTNEEKWEKGNERRKEGRWGT